ncbi:LysM peptidoglycan-binding domain-containing protein [Natronincola ferrireducens]|uniref:LysM domain-containing protein n=1 Tax=Natronincola ferrireducens TaxID=393762 RepID=A0A1G9GSV0_9FIRM|nr:LysM peptidoglycan-binding domain-containing protein [Natronincola ferrireducens]SDL03728.1 LysM domain-containing protein [Natronincola ferrireducens]
MYNMYHSQTSCPLGTAPYVIRAGDTFFAIAMRYGISLEALIAANPGVNPDRLFIGQIICIPMKPPSPPPTACPPGTMPYVIRAGDTFYSIARRYNVSLDALIAANPGVDPDRLQIGQVICIPVTPPPPPPPPPPPTPVCPTLRRTSTGPSVRQLQELLRDAGFDPGPIDGIFGPRTEEAVRTFQRSKGLTVDGIVGVQTWTALGVDCSVVPPPTCPTGTTPYTIRAGDTFFALAERFNTTVDAIRRANPGVDPNNLQIGQVICMPTTTPPPTCPTGTTPYTIRAGDTFFALAERFNTTVDAIRRANPGVDPNNLQIGQVICIPTTTPPPTCPTGTTPYTIRAGDTFFALAERFNTTVDAIRRANPGVDPNNLQIGQVICIPTA